jgi:2-amino-4-hydroxy-6-hydroxymethyldihydropteridine diphosphokinase
MSLILALGSNVGDRLKNLQEARLLLCEKLKLTFEGKIQETAPVDYFNQNYFLNQLLEFEIPNLAPLEFIQWTQSIEMKMGRVKTIPKGPRLIDIDVIFWGQLHFSHENLQIPHAQWKKRDFIYEPLKELPSYGQFHWDQNHLI